MARPPHAMAGRPHGTAPAGASLSCAPRYRASTAGSDSISPARLLRRGTARAEDFRMRAVLPRTAALRVYEPLEAFPEPERSRWAAYASRSAAARAAASAQKRDLRLAGLAATPPIVVPADEGEDASVLMVRDVLHVCPEQSRL